MEINLAHPSTELVQATGVTLTPPPRELVQIIFENCIQQNSAQLETIRLKASRRGIKILTFGCGIGGAVPNIPLALKSGGGNLGLGITVACANFITRTFLVTWSYHNIIDGEIGSNGRITRQIADKKLSTSKRVAIKTTVFVIAIIAQTPRAYLAYVYNNQSILYPILTYVSLTAIPAFSLDLSFTAGLELRNLTKFERSLNKIKGKMKRITQGCRSTIIKLSPQERQALATNLAILGNQPAEAAVMAFLSRVCKESDSSTQTQTLSQKIRKVASQALSGLTAVATTAAQTGFNFWIGVQGAKAVWDNPIFAYTIGALILGSNLYLTTKVMSGRSKALFKQIFFKPLQLLTGNSVCSTLIPKTRATVGLAAIGSSSFSTGTMVQAVTDYFNEELYYILVVLVPLSMFILGHQALNDIADELCLQVLLRSNLSEDEQNVLKIDHALKRFEFIVEKMSFEYFAKILIALPDDVFTSFIGNTVSKEELYVYIRGKANARLENA